MVVYFHANVFLYFFFAEQYLTLRCTDNNEDVQDTTTMDVVLGKMHE